jgi:hypothetical protein
LWEKVSKQQQIIEGLSEKVVQLSEVLPDQDRRRFLKTGVGAGALLAAGAVGRSTAGLGDDSDPVSSTDSDRESYDIDEADANLLSTSELATDPPETPFQWQGKHSLLSSGYCVNSRGQVYSGFSAIQNAIDDLTRNDVNGTVWAGEGTYGPVTIQTEHYITLKGMGASTSIDGGSTDHAISILDPQSAFAARIQVKDVTVRTDSASDLDGVHIESVNGNKVYECWLDRIQCQTVGRDAVHLQSVDNSARVEVIDIRGLFLEDAKRRGVHIGTNTFAVNVQGVELAVANDHEVIYSDGIFATIKATRLTKDNGTTSGMIFGSNARDSVAMIGDPSIDGTENNGSRCSIITGSDAL